MLHTVFFFVSADQFEMSLDEFYIKTTNQPSRDFAINEGIAGRAAEYRQFDVIGEDSSQTVKDSIHLDWIPLSDYCIECGVTVKMWDGFAHQILWNQTWPRAVAFQPLSTRYETERSDSPIEGFVFRLWEWGYEVGDTFSVGRPLRPTKPSEKAIITTTSEPLDTKNDDNDTDEEEESIFTKYATQRDYEDEEEIHNSDQHPGAAASVPWVLSNILPFGRPPNLRGLLRYGSCAYLVDQQGSSTVSLLSEGYENDF